MSKDQVDTSSKRSALTEDQVVNIATMLRKYQRGNALVALSPIAPGHPYELGIQFGTAHEAAFFQQEWTERGINFQQVNIQGIQGHFVAIGSRYVAVEKGGEDYFNLTVGHNGYDSANGQVIRQPFAEDIRIQSRPLQRKITRVLPRARRVQPLDNNPRVVRPARTPKVPLNPPRQTQGN